MGARIVTEQRNTARGKRPPKRAEDEWEIALQLWWIMNGVRVLRTLSPKRRVAPALPRATAVSIRFKRCAQYHSRCLFMAAHLFVPGQGDQPGLRPPTASVTWSAAARTRVPTASAWLSDRRKVGPETEIPATGSPWALKIGAATQRIPSARS